MPLIINIPTNREDLKRIAEKHREKKARKLTMKMMRERIARENWLKSAACLRQIKEMTKDPQILDLIQKYNIPMTK